MVDKHKSAKRVAKTFYSISPFYPVEVIDSQDYFHFPVKVAEEMGMEGYVVPLNQLIKSVYNVIKPNSVVHFHGVSRRMLYLIWLFKRNRKGCKLIITPHGAFGRRVPPWLVWGLFSLTAWLIKDFDHIIAISPYEQEQWLKKGLKSTYIPLAIDTKVWAKIRKHRFPKKEFLFFGGDRKEKGKKLLNKAIKGTFLGGTITENKTAQECGCVRLLKRVKFGTVEYFNLYKDHKFFINSSIIEGFPLGVAEAYISGMTLFLPRLPTLMSIYEGEAVFYENAQDLRQKIYSNYYKVSVPDPKLVKSFSIETVSKKLSKVYREVM